MKLIFKLVEVSLRSAESINFSDAGADAAEGQGNLPSVVIPVDNVAELLSFSHDRYTFISLRIYLVICSVCVA